MLDRFCRVRASHPPSRAPSDKSRSATLGWGLAVALAILSLGCAKSEGPKRSPPPKPPSFESPEAVLRSARAAAAGRDYATLCRCITPESLEMQAGVLVYTSASLSLVDKMPTALPAAGALLGDDEGVEHLKAMERMKAAKPRITAVLKKHGLSGQLDPTSWPRIDSPADMRVLAEPAPDKAAFVAEMLETMAACGLMDQDDWMFGRGPMTGVKISGDTATGTIRDPKLGDDYSLPIRFKRTDERWLIDMEAK